MPKRALIFLTLLCLLIIFKTHVFAIKTTQIDAILEGVLERHQLPGITVGIFNGPKNVYVKSLGYADLILKRKQTPSREFRIASITKTFAATVLLQLVSEGKIKLDDPIHKFFHCPHSKEITVRHLLNHTSGIDEGILPGKRWRYSNSNYIILGEIIKKLTNKSVTENIEERIIKPLKLKHTYFPTTSGFKGKYTRGYAYYYSQKKQRTLRYDRTHISPPPRGAVGAMISNLSDLKVWSQTLAKGKLLNPQMKKEQFKFIPAKSMGVGVKYGLGVMNVDGFIGHEGRFDGYSSGMYYHPKLDLGIVILINRYPTKSIYLPRYIMRKLVMILLKK